jgi:hypothetical protein
MIYFFFFFLEGADTGATGGAIPEVAWVTDGGNTVDDGTGLGGPDGGNTVDEGTGV